MNRMPEAKRTVTALLAIAMLASLASCGGSAPTSDTTAADASADTTTAAPETAYIDTLEQRDMGGKEFIFYGQHYSGRQNFYMEEKDGEVCNDAMHKRDAAVEERLNVKLVFIGEQDRAKVKATAQASILAGDEEYNVILAPLSDGMNTLTSAGVLYNLRKIPHLTLDSIYWNKSMYDHMEIGGAQFFTTGGISYSFFQTPIVMRANMRLIDEYKLENPYELVLSGKWTADKLAEMSKDKYQDLNGNSTPDTGDFFGLIMDGTFGNALYTGAGFDTVSREGGKCTLTLDSQQSIDLIEKYASLFGDRKQYMNDLAGSESWNKDIFMAGDCIFQPMTILGTLSLREMKDDFAILPIPKYTEEQKEYYTACNTWLPSGIAIPVNCSDPDNTGLMLETMAYYSNLYVRPAMYETTLQGKVARDDNAVSMLDLIYNGAAFDFATAFNFANVGNLLREMVTGDQENFVSSYASIKDAAHAALDDIVKAAEE